jgi:hypothetical protein
MLPRLALALVLAGCTVDTGIIPSNRYIDRDIEATRRGEARDVQDLRAFEPGLPPPSRGANSFAPF